MPYAPKKAKEKMKKVNKPSKKLFSAIKAFPASTQGKSNKQAGTMASAKVPSTAGVAKRAATKAATKLVRNRLVKDRTPAGVAQAAAKRAVPVLAMQIQSDRSRAATRSRAQENKMAMVEKKAKKKAVKSAARRIVGGY